MEQHATAFLRQDVPIHDKLLDFFPGLVALPGALATLVAAATKGLPEREIFCRALSTLSARPSLILSARLDHVPSNAAVTSEPQVVHVSCTSPFFALGWHKIEPSRSDPFRWMEQIGVILNPQPSRSIARIEVVVEGWYGPGDRTITGIAGDSVLICEDRETDNGGRTLVFTKERGATFIAHRFTLVASQAACPWHYDGTPDARLLSCQVTGATFVFDGEAA